MSNEVPDLAAMGLTKSEEPQTTALPPDDDAMEALGVLLESVQVSLQPVKEALNGALNELASQRRVNAALRFEVQALKNRMNMAESIAAILMLRDPELQVRARAMVEAMKAAEAMEKEDANKKQVLPVLPAAT